MPEAVYKPRTETEISATADLVSASGGAEIGIVAQPASGSITAVIKRLGPFFNIDFTLTAARISVTDAGAGGSFGSLTFFTFAQGGLNFLGSRQNYTAFAEGSALTTAAGDAVHVLGLGTVAISSARDGTLTGTEQDIGNLTSQITNSGGTGAGTKHTGILTTPQDGTATAISMKLNWSGTAATIDANSTIDVTGTLTVAGVLTGEH